MLVVFFKKHAQFFLGIFFLFAGLMLGYTLFLYNSVSPSWLYDVTTADGHYQECSLITVVPANICGYHGIFVWMDGSFRGDVCSNFWFRVSRFF